jgi:hypothetical protein
LQIFIKLGRIICYAKNIYERYEAKKEKRGRYYSKVTNAARFVMYIPNGIILDVLAVGVVF